MTDQLLPHLMPAVVVSAHGGAEVLEVRQQQVPTPGAGQVLIRVAAAGVNFRDVYERAGAYPRETPFVLGMEAAGTVAAVGAGVEDVAGLALGASVASAAVSGAMAGYAVAPAVRVVPVPDPVSPDLAAAIMLQGMTAHYLVTSLYQVRPGDQVLIHAAAGGVGQLLIQLVRARGAHVVATVGSAAKADIAAALGADTVLRYDEISAADDLAAAIREASRGGVHVAYDGVGQASFDASLAALRPRGMLALFGAASGRVEPVDPQRLNAAGSVFLTRPTLNDYVATREELLWRSGELFAALADGSLTVQIGGRYAFADARRAYAELEGRRTTGKLLLVP